MAFWYNLKASGEGDYMTRHAGCPVLTGSKWGRMASKFAKYLATNALFVVVTNFVYFIVM